MPRRDLTEERTEQILDAFERCVARHGIEGTSLERVAEEASVKRSILRHYVGNRDELILAMARRFADRYREQMREMSAYVGAESGTNRVERLLECLFSNTGDFHDVLVVEALVAVAHTNDEVREIVAGIVDETVDGIREQLRSAYPDSDARSAWSVACGVVGIWFNHDSLRPLALSNRYTSAAIDSARRLVRTLD